MPEVLKNIDIYLYYISIDIDFDIPKKYIDMRYIENCFKDTGKI